MTTENNTRERYPIFSLPISSTGHVFRLTRLCPLAHLGMDDEWCNYAIAKVKGLDDEGKQILEYLDRVECFKVENYAKGDILKLVLYGRSWKRSKHYACYYIVEDIDLENRQFSMIAFVDGEERLTYETALEYLRETAA